MPHAPSLPLEIIEQIIQDVASVDLVGVRNCARTCWTLVPICRKYLFENIQVYVNVSTELHDSLKNLVALLQKSPEIADYTRYFRLRIEWPSHLTRLQNLQPVLPTEFKMFTKLETYVIECHLSEDSRFQNEATPQLMEIFVRPIPTLTKYYLDFAVANFPFHELPLCYPNLGFLELGQNFHVDRLDDIIVPKGALPLKPIKIEHFVWKTSDALAVQKILELRQSNDEPVIDISSLKHLELCIYDGWNWITETVAMLFQSHLTTLILKSCAKFQTAIDLTGIGQLLLASRMSLKEIRIFTDAEDDVLDDNPLHGLCEELEIFGRYPNILESLSYMLYIWDVDSRCSTGDEWAALNRVIDNFEWPMLKKLSIHIFTSEMKDFYRDDDGRI